MQVSHEWRFKGKDPSKFSSVPGKLKVNYLIPGQTLED
jgi:hypothetical protein